MSDPCSWCNATGFVGTTPCAECNRQNVRMGKLFFLDEERAIWRPVKVACWHCGASYVTTACEWSPHNLECAECELQSCSITHEPPVGWASMSEDELREHGFVPVR